MQESPSAQHFKIIYLSVIVHIDSSSQDTDLEYYALGGLWLLLVKFREQSNSMSGMWDLNPNLLVKNSCSVQTGWNIWYQVGSFMRVKVDQDDRLEPCLGNQKGVRRDAIKRKIN